MAKLRFLLIVVLTVLLDGSSPIPAPAAEALQEFEDAAVRRRGRATFRLVRDTVPLSVAREAHAAELARSLPRPIPPRPAHVMHAGLRKIPPSVAEPSAPEAH